MQTNNNMEHYFAPSVGWTVAVSRRFHGDGAVLLYERSILPILRQHGTVLECSYASDDRESPDYWVRRINVILEVADIHVLLDIDRSGYVDYEFDISQRLAIRSRATQTQTLLNWAPEAGVAILHPKRILITDRHGRETYSRPKRTFTLGIRGSSVGDVQARLDRALLNVKRRRTRYLRWGLRLQAFLPRSIRDSQPVPLAVAEDAYRVALALSEGRPIPELERELHATERRVEEKHPLHVVAAQVGDDISDFHLARRTGRVVVPVRFRDRYAFIRAFYSKQLGRLFGDDALESRGFRAILMFVAFAGALSRIGFRRALEAAAPDDPS
jgi:hypothetical protein